MVRTRRNIVGWPERAMLACGGVAAALGMLALIGWHARLPILIQVSAQFVPMAYNTALGFVLCGMGMMLRGYDGPSRWVVSCGGLIGLLGAATLVQEAVGGARPLDSLFSRASLAAAANQAAMAPNTALCFLFVGLSLVLGGCVPRHKHGSAFVAMMGSIVLALAVAALFGYSLGVSAAYGWSTFTQMALLTACGFVFVGFGVIALAWRMAVGDEARVPHWLALLPGAALFTTALLLSGFEG